MARLSVHGQGYGRCHENTFRFFGGITTEVIYDHAVPSCNPTRRVGPHVILDDIVYMIIVEEFLIPTWMVYS